MNLDYEEIKSEASAILRDEDGVYANETMRGVKYALRMLAEQGVLDTESVSIITLPANVCELDLAQFGRAEVSQIDWSWAEGSPEIWYKLEKSPFQGADFSRLNPPVGRPYRWTLWGSAITFDGCWQQDTKLRLHMERSFRSGGSLPDIGEKYYDAVLQLAVAYVQQNFLNIDATAAQNQAAAAVQRLLESRSRQLSGGQIQPFIF